MFINADYYHICYSFYWQFQQKLIKLSPSGRFSWPFLICIWDFYQGTRVYLFTWLCKGSMFIHVIRKRNVSYLSLSFSQYSSWNPSYSFGLIFISEIKLWSSKSWYGREDLFKCTLRFWFYGSLTSLFDFIINLFKDFLIKVLILFHVIKGKFSFGETIISMHEAVSNVLPIEHYGSSFWRHKYNTNEIYLFGVLCTSKCLNRYKLWERI